MQSAASWLDHRLPLSTSPCSARRKGKHLKSAVRHWQARSLESGCALYCPVGRLFRKIVSTSTGSMADHQVWIIVLPLQRGPEAAGNTQESSGVSCHTTHTAHNPCGPSSMQPLPGRTPDADDSLQPCAVRAGLQKICKAVSSQRGLLRHACGAWGIMDFAFPSRPEELLDQSCLRTVTVQDLSQLSESQAVEFAEGEGPLYEYSPHAMTLTEGLSGECRGGLCHLQRRCSGYCGPVCLWQGLQPGQVRG